MFRRRPKKKPGKETMRRVRSPTNKKVEKSPQN